MLNKLIKKENGNVIILVSLLLAILMSMMAFVIDMGVVYAEKAKLSKAIDAAILAGGQELPNDISKARAVMEEYLENNGVSIEEVDISIDHDGMGAEIVGVKSVDHYFAKIMGINTTEVTESSRIILGSVTSATGGIRPFGVTKYDFEYGDPIILKEGAGDGYHGNYGVIALGGMGASTFLENAMYGYDGTLRVGEFVDTEPGNMAGVVNTLSYYMNSIDETFDNYDRGSDRIWTIPVFDTLEVEGREAVEIVGFAQLFVEGVTKEGGDAEITGRFLQFVINGDIDPEQEATGALGMKLVD